MRERKKDGEVGVLRIPCVLSRVPLSATPWTVARQAPLSMKFPKQEHWSGLPGPPPGDLPNPGIEPVPPAFEAQSLNHWTTWEVPGDMVFNEVIKLE